LPLSYDFAIGFWNCSNSVVLLYPYSTGGGYTVLPLSVLPSVRPSVRPSVCPSFRPSFRLSVLPSVSPSFRPSKKFFIAFFSATIDGRNLIFGHKLHIRIPYCGKRFWTRQIPTSCLPTLLVFMHIEHICGGKFILFVFHFISCLFCLVSGLLQYTLLKTSYEDRSTWKESKDKANTEMFVANRNRYLQTYVGCILNIIFYYQETNQRD